MPDEWKGNPSSQMWFFIQLRSSWQDFNWLKAKSNRSALKIKPKILQDFCAALLHEFWVCLKTFKPRYGYRPRLIRSWLYWPCVRRSQVGFYSILWQLLNYWTVTRIYKRKAGPWHSDSAVINTTVIYTWLLTLQIFFYATFITKASALRSRV